MKRPLTIAATALLAVLVLYACSSTIRTINSSFVTVTIGGVSGTALLKAEAATPWTKFKYYLADAKWMPEAYAYIPSIVQVITVTVTAPDITTPIVGVKSINKTDTVSSLRIEVPNGTGRQFLVEGYRGFPNGATQLFYSGITGPVELSGTDVTLPVTMALVGPGILVDTLHSQATDTAGCGTVTLPCKTIGFALNSRTSGTDAIIVSAGTYTLTVGAGPATLQLKPANALICLGTGTSTVIDASSTVDDLLYGADGASVDNCTLIPGSDTTAINDQGTSIKINGVLIDANQQVGGALDGIMLSADSLVLETTVLNTTWHGINILSGKPTIKDSTISLNPTGIEITGGDPEIINSTIDSNSTGMSIPSAGKPLVSGSIFSNNGTGIDLSAGIADISASVFTGNSTGLFITGGSPRIQTSEIANNGSYGIQVSGVASDPEISSCRIFCNYFYNVYTTSTTTLRVRNNSWENAPPLVSSTFNGCSQGDDVCYDYLGPVPLTDPYNPAAIAPGTCVRLIGKPLKK